MPTLDLVLPFMYELNGRLFPFVAIDISKLCLALQTAVLHSFWYFFKP